MIAGREPADDVDVATNAEMRAHTVRAIAGLTRTTYEMLTGLQVATGEPRCVPMNPQGEYGIDLSGPPFGSAIRHPIVTFGGLRTTSNAAGEKTAALVTSTAPKSWTFSFWVRPFCQYPSAPYSRGYLCFMASCYSGTNKDITFKLYKGNGATYRTATYTVASTTDEAFDVDDAFVELVPGMNRVTIQATSTSSTGVYLGGLSLNQIVKRRHALP